MSLAPFPTESNIFTALGKFLQLVLPSGVVIVQAQDNRVPEPSGTDYVVMQKPRFERLATNIDGWADCSFIGAIAGSNLSVTELLLGSITIQNSLFGPNVTWPTTITGQVSGTPGGIGVYTVSPPQTVVSGKLACGAIAHQQNSKVTVQLDVHGPNSADNAQTISTLFRDEYAVEQFASQTPQYGVVPLLADDPRQIPFLNDQSQIEQRYVIEAQMQVDQTVSTPQQFADELEIGLVDVDEQYPPS